LFGYFGIVTGGPLLTGGVMRLIAQAYFEQ
jgi:hypothetical protein